MPMMRTSAILAGRKREAMRPRGIGGVALAVCLMAAPSAAQEAPGIVSGVVTDAALGGPLEGAVVKLDGQAVGVATDARGAFTLLNVPAGRRTVIVSYLGRGDVRRFVDVPAGDAAFIELALQSAYTEQVEVRGDLIQEG